MNLTLGAPMWLTAILLLALAAAAIEDAIRLRISNVTSAVVFVAAIAGMALHGFPLGLWQNLVVFLAILAVGTVAFSHGWLGGGDVKLLAALGLWMDLKGALQLLVAVSIAGGVLAVTYLIVKAMVGRRKSRRSGQLPYGVAIAAGALISIGLQVWYSSPTGTLAKIERGGLR
jgi:prepilin peptidase CpaA